MQIAATITRMVPKDSQPTHSWIPASGVSRGGWAGGAGKMTLAIKVRAPRALLVESQAGSFLLASSLAWGGRNAENSESKSQFLKSAYYCYTGI